ncbi:MAG: serine/threonine protein kinase [Planctomycetales bacterium]|nr:serine/threonine protein kinase [Planctomycetales bacterium]
MKACRPEWLEPALIDTLDDQQLDQLTQHLDACPRCRSRLEQETTDDPWWLDSRELLTESSAAQATIASPLASPATTLPHVSTEPRVARHELSFLAPALDDDLLGRLDHYQIQSVLGRGGMGIVLGGFDPALNRSVAIKVLAPTLAAQGIARQRFIREAQAAAAVAHPHVIAIHAVAPLHDPPYFVMPLVAGPSLQKRIDSVGALDIEEVLTVGLQIAEGLSAAHRRGLVHRDVKPANVLLEPGTDRVVLTDFGLARAADDATLTGTGIIAGTPQFMAPEQTLGAPIDARSDLFSLGSVLYTMLTGVPPFRSNTTMGLLRAIAESPARPITQLAPRVPSWLARIVERLMHKDPNHRYASAESLVEDLRAALAHWREPQRTSLPKRLSASQHSTHQRLALALVGCLLAAASIGLVLSGAWHSPAATEVQSPKQSARTASSSSVAEPPFASSNTKPPNTLAANPISNNPIDSPPTSMTPPAVSPPSHDQAWNSESLDQSISNLRLHIELLEGSLNE